MKGEEFGWGCYFVLALRFSGQGRARRCRRREAREQQAGGGVVADMGSLEASKFAHEGQHMVSDAPRSRDEEMGGVGAHAECSGWLWGMKGGRSGSGRRQRGGEQQWHPEDEIGESRTTWLEDGSPSSRRDLTARKRNRHGSTPSTCECPSSYERGWQGDKVSELVGVKLPLRPEGRKRMQGWGIWSALTTVMTVLFFIMGATRAEWASGLRQSDGEKCQIQHQHSPSLLAHSYIHARWLTPNCRTSSDVLPFLGHLERTSGRGRRELGWLHQQHHGRSPVHGN